MPPRASISLTSWPLEVPPIEGLHGRFARLSNERVKRIVSRPSFAHACAASHPAWPAPPTATSNVPASKLLSNSKASRIVIYLPMQNLEKIVSANVADTVLPVTSPISSRHALNADAHTSVPRLLSSASRASASFLDALRNLE